MDAVADLADRYSFGELRVSHEQNLILADVRQSRSLRAVAAKRRRSGLATPNIGLLTNIIAARAATSARSPTRSRSRSPRRSSAASTISTTCYDIGELDLNISGCMNSCGHHHVGHIGILGVDKQGAEWYQISIGGAQGERRVARQGDRPSSRRTRCPT